MVTNVSDKRSASIFRLLVSHAKRQWLIISSKPTSPHSVATRQTTVDIFTAVITPTSDKVVSCVSGSHFSCFFTSLSLLCFYLFLVFAFPCFYFILFLPVSLWLVTLVYLSCFPSFVFSLCIFFLHFSLFSLLLFYSFRVPFLSTTLFFSFFFLSLFQVHAIVISEA
jgi:hypothetical protein